MNKLNVMKIANVLTAVLMVAILLMPILVLAQGFTIPQGGPVDGGDTQTISDIILRFIEILLAIAGLIAVIFLIIGGFRYITAGGNEESAESGKKTITNAIIGIVVIILAFVIVRVIANAIIGQDV